MYTTVSARLDTEIKKQAEATLSKIGLTHSAAVTALYSQIVLQKGLPFEVRIPQEKQEKILSYWEIRDAVRDIAKEYDIDKAWLFGSYARGDATSASDVDLRIDKGGLRGLELGGFVYDLEQKLGVSVDIITTPGASEELLAAIKPDEEVVYER